MITDEKQCREEVLRISGVNTSKCMRCGKCSGTCPSYSEMEFPPHKFVYMVEQGEIEPLLKSETLYHCLSCFACVDRCPRNVQPTRLIEAVRLMAVRQQGQNRLNAGDIPELIDEDTPQQLLVSALRKFAK